MVSNQPKGGIAAIGGACSISATAGRSAALSRSWSSGAHGCGRTASTAHGATIAQWGESGDSTGEASLITDAMPIRRAKQIIKARYIIG